MKYLQTIPIICLFVEICTCFNMKDLFKLKSFGPSDVAETKTVDDSKEIKEIKHNNKSKNNSKPSDRISEDDIMDDDDYFEKRRAPSTAKKSHTKKGKKQTKSGWNSRGRK